MPVFLCTYASEDQKGAAEVLRDTALRIGGVDQVLVMDEKHPLIKMLRDKASDKYRFEWKYWKPYIIDFVLHHVKNGDVVIYCDPTLSFVSPVGPLIDKAFKRGKHAVLCRVGGYGSGEALAKHFCKQDCFDAMDCGDDAYKTNVMIDSAIQMYKKSAGATTFVKDYVGFCTQIDAIDTVCRKPNDPTFQEHRCEQSVLTNLSLRHKSKVTVMRSIIAGNEEDADPSGINPGACLTVTVDPPPFKKIIVVTPTIGTEHLKRCIESVQWQTMLGVEHLIVIDGPEYADKVEKIVEPYRLRNPVRTMVLPFNVGAGGWCGHRVYASIPLLLDCDYVAYLDEDNTYDPTHLKQLYDLVSKDGLDWAFSLRRIVDKDGNHVDYDNCESLGNLCHSVLGWNDFLVDTSCYLFKLDVARAASPHWMHKTRQEGGVEADRSVTQFLLTHPTFKGKGTSKHTLNYMVASNASTSVTGQFFLDGNKVFKYDFGSRPTIYIFHFNPEQTQTFLVSMHKTDRSYALDEWQMTLLRGLKDKYNLVNGYAVEPFIPSGSVVYVSMCHLQELPAATLQREDVVKVLYTIESPNIRHQQQWDLNFLQKHFDRLLTYWTPILEAHPRATFCPQNTHHLDLDNPHDRKLLHTPSKPAGRDVVMVLERRDLGGDYEINGVPLQCLDPLRQTYVERLKDITVYGIGWDRFKKNPLLKIGHTKHRSLDDRSTVDIIKDYTFALIIENTNADGYVSEKIYDALIAGCIPIYYGNNNANVGIPEDMYIDLRKIPTSEDLQKYLDKMTLKDITAKRKHILKHREEVLRKVSTKAFAEAFEKVLA